MSTTMSAPVQSTLFPAAFNPKEYKLISLRECPMPESMHGCSTPAQAAAYFNSAIRHSATFNPEVETLVVLFLNTRLKIKGHQVIANGILDTLLAHPREVFRAAIVCAAAAIVLLHNHPSGDPTPSAADISVTRELIKAGKIIKIEVQDHLVIGAGERFQSLRELGYFYN